MKDPRDDVLHVIHMLRHRRRQPVPYLHIAKMLNILKYKPWPGDPWDGPFVKKLYWDALKRDHYHNWEF